MKGFLMSSGKNYANPLSIPLHKALYAAGEANFRLSVLFSH